MYNIHDIYTIQPNPFKTGLCINNKSRSKTLAVNVSDKNKKNDAPHRFAAPIFALHLLLAPTDKRDTLFRMGATATKHNAEPLFIRLHGIMRRHNAKTRHRGKSCTEEDRWSPGTRVGVQSERVLTIPHAKWAFVIYVWGGRAGYGGGGPIALSTTPPYSCQQVLAHARDDVCPQVHH